MNPLHRLLSEVPNVVLEQVLEAVTRQVPLDHVWVKQGAGDDGCGGCFAVIICHAAVNEVISLDFEYLPDDGTHEMVLAEKLGISPDIIEAAWHYWDYSMNDRRRARFIKGLREELRLLRKRKFEHQVASVVDAIPVEMLVRR